MGDHRRAACASGHVIPRDVRQPSGYTQLARRSGGVLLDAGSSSVVGCGCEPSLRTINAGVQKAGRQLYISDLQCCQCAAASACVAHQRTKIGAAIDGRTDRFVLY